MSAAAAWDDSIVSACAPGRPHLRLVPTGDAVPAPAPRRMRITRRGRLTMTLTVAVLIAVAAFSAWSSLAVASPSPSTAVAVTVGAGESLSEIAARELPGEETDRAVVRIVEANHLPSDQVLAGQRIVIPGR